VLRRTDEEVEYELLCSMEFTSDRKRMSVIVKLPDGKLKLYSKGADSVMLERLKEGEDDDVRRKTKKQLHELAKSGLRTLILAEKELSQEECDKFLEQYNEASNKIDDREEAVRFVPCVVPCVSCASCASCCVRSALTGCDVGAGGRGVRRDGKGPCAHRSHGYRGQAAEGRARSHSVPARRTSPAPPPPPPPQCPSPLCDTPDQHRRTFVRVYRRA
jgi:hypothetical protein